MGSANRVPVLTETLTRQPFLNRPSTFIALHDDQWKQYRSVRKQWPKITYFSYPNPYGSVSVMCEHLRRAAMETDDPFSRYVRADDNASFSEQSLHNLVRASMIYPKQPVVVGGMQGSDKANAKPSRFDESYAKRSGHTVAGLRFYNKIAMMFWCFPHELFSKLRYPLDRGCMEDHYAALTCLRMGATFVTCMDAPFKKKRFRPGGQGNFTERAKKIGYAWIRMGEMFPEFMGEVRMVWPYAKFYKIAEQMKKEKK
jgi:hypothetical protein